jgi:hypothetical protein
MKVRNPKSEIRIMAKAKNPKGREMAGAVKFGSLVPVLFWICS